MRIDGIILPSGADTRVNREAWCRLIAGRPELRRSPSRQIINPFNGEPAVVHPSPGAAQVVVDGAVVGNAGWSQREDDPMVYVSVERSALSLVLSWAAELGGEFREYAPPAEAHT